VKIDLGDVLEIDKEKMIVRVEPAVTIGFLNRLLVANGYTLPVVPELDILTIGRYMILEPSPRLLTDTLYQ
jgi:delta24-sterol reductase